MRQTVERVVTNATTKRPLLDDLPVFGARLAADGRILECNFPTLGGCNTRFQRDPRFLRGRELSSLHYWSHDPISIAKIQNWVSRCEKGESVSDDLPYRRLSGENGTLRFTIQPEYGDDARLVFMTCTCSDITELRSTQSRLRSTEKRFQEMAHGLPHMVWMDDTRGVQVFANRAYCEFFNVSDFDLSADVWRDRVHPEDKDYCTNYDNAVANREPFTDQVRFRHASGQWRSVETFAKPNYTQVGEFVGFISTSVDVTERLKVEARLAEIDRRKDEFLATLGHELRNPLAPIVSSVELIKESDPEDQRVIGAVEIIERQSRQMATLLDDLMDASRVSQGHFELCKSVECLEDVVKKAVEAVQPRLDKAGHTLHQHVPMLPSWVKIDPLRISQVMTNLLNNAIKFTPTGGDITIGIAASDEGYEISVSDSGRGIAAEEVDKVFNMYTQLDKSPANGEAGLGVGLALSRDLVNRHGGTLTVYSEGIEQGSTFTVWLPPTIKMEGECLDEEPIDDRYPLVNHDSDSAVARSDGVSSRVLVVDDNIDAGLVLSQLLEHLGVEATLVHNGKDALESANRLQPDMILLDIGLPDISGHDVARQIRAMPWASKTMLIAVSGLSHENDISKSLQAGFDMHKVKPVSLMALRPLVDQLGS